MILMYNEPGSSVVPRRPIEGITRLSRLSVMSAVWLDENVLIKIHAAQIAHHGGMNGLRNYVLSRIAVRGRGVNATSNEYEESCCPSVRNGRDL
jgi:hypothetical protein